MPTATSSTQSMLPETAPTPTDAQRGTATTSTPTAAAPEIVEAPVETVAVPAEPMSSGEPRNTGSFPNLNVKPGAANAQISDEEKAAELDALRAAQAEQQATAPVAGKEPTNPVLLRKLAAQHAAEALKKIQGK